MTARATLAPELLVQQRQAHRAAQAARSAGDGPATADALATALEIGVRVTALADAEIADREKGAAA